MLEKKNKKLKEELESKRLSDNDEFFIRFEELQNLKLKISKVSMLIVENFLKL